VLPILFIIIILYGSGEDRIRSALLLFLYTLAGLAFIELALYLAICWKHFLILIESQSAGNLLVNYLLDIFREYTPEIVCCNNFLISNPKESLDSCHSKKDDSPSVVGVTTAQNKFKFTSYLTGLIEGDGSIHVPNSERSAKGKLYYPSISLAFHLKELPLALLIQKNLGFGSISRRKGAKAYYLVINDKRGILSMVNLLNGNMRTPKINFLYKLIDYLNNQKSVALGPVSSYASQGEGVHTADKIINLPLCTRPLNEDAWFSGFIEADGHFSVRTTLIGKYPKLECKFELSQSQTDPLGNDKYSFLSGISEFLKTSIKIIKENSPHPQYRLRTTNLESNFILINYLNQYPLFGSKFLDFNNWKEVLELFRLGKKDNLHEVIKLKSEMNNNRTFFTWDHLHKFYNLDY